VRAILARPGAVLSHRDLWPATATGALAASFVVGMPNLLTTREVAMHAVASAALAVDPDPHLAVLRHWSRALWQADSQIQAMIALAIEDMAPDAHSEALVGGSLSATAAAAWIADRPDAVALVAAACRTERLGWLPVIGHYPAVDLGREAWGWDGPGSAVLGLWGWAVQDGDWALQERLLLAGEAALATGATPPAMVVPTWWRRALHPIGHYTHGNAALQVDLALRHEANARIRRIAAALWFGARGEPAATATRAMPVVAPLLDRGPARLRLGVESLGGRRIRVAIDPALPQPGGLDRSRLPADRCIGGGRRARDGSGSWIREGVVVDLPP
jgi:hypothetical protein